MLRVPSPLPLRRSSPARLCQAGSSALFSSTVVVAVALAACAHAPADRTLEGPAYEPRGADLPPAPPPEPVVEPEPPVAEGTATEFVPAEEPTAVAGLTPAQYADLFDRIRSGFKLDEEIGRASCRERV